jgi:hypothetical protein
MTEPADGIERLIHFVDARIAQLDLSKQEVARRGGPNPDTLAKIRDRDTARTPNVDTLLRLDQTLGWHPGSSAVTMLGGIPLSLNAIGPAPGRPRKQSPVRPMTATEIQNRLAEQLNDEITRLETTRDALDRRIAALRTAAQHFAAEIARPEDIAAYQTAATAPTARRGPGRRTASTG